jgi:hypothetical protein
MIARVSPCGSVKAPSSISRQRTVGISRKLTRLLFAANIGEAVIAAGRPRFTSRIARATQRPEHGFEHGTESLRAEIKPLRFHDEIRVGSRLFAHAVIRHDQRRARRQQASDALDRIRGHFNAAESRARDVG